MNTIFMTDKQSNSKFVKYFDKKVRTTIKRYKLFSKQDKIAVAVSGGKDSTVCLYVLKKLGYDVEGITIDAAIGNYTNLNLENLKEVCEEYAIKLNIVEFRREFGMSLCYMKSILSAKGHNYSSCMLCGIMKRYLLNKHSKKMNFDRLATGHNLDDEAQTFMMNVFRNDFKTATRQGPIAGLIESGMFIKRVKPLYFLSEEEIKRYSKMMKFPVNYEICPCSVDAYRRKFINMLNDFEKNHPDVKYNIVRFQEAMAKKVTPPAESEISLCIKCGEPASNKKCKTCLILDELKGQKER